jgi:hypothetical protein
MSKRKHVSWVRSFHACRLKWRDWCLLRSERWTTRVDFRRPRRLHVKGAGLSRG